MEMEMDEEAEVDDLFGPGNEEQEPDGESL